MSDAILFLCALITLANVAVAMFVSLVAATIVYSWWKKLQATNDQLPQMLQASIDDMAAKFIEPYREILDEKGRAKVQPNVEPPDTITLEEDFQQWTTR